MLQRSQGTLERRKAAPPPVLQPPREWDPRCARCGQPATQQFHCSGCGLERAYCQQYACQADDWSKHPPKCRGLAGTIFNEDTTITRLSDGSTYSRRRRRSISSNADLMERMAVLELESTQIIRPDMEGWLACPGDTLQLWRLLFFEIKDDVLFCFDTDVSRCRGAIALTGFNARFADTEIKSKYSIKLYNLDDGRVHFFVAQSQQDAHAWLAAILRAAAITSPEARVTSVSASTPTSPNDASPATRASFSSRATFSAARRNQLITASTSVDGNLKQLADSVPSSGGSAASAPTEFPRSTSFSKLLTAVHHGTEEITERTLLVRAEMLPLGAPAASVRAARLARRPSSLASNWNLADQLVRVQLTRTLVDSQFEVYDSLSRSAAVSRIMDQPAPYPRQAISDTAAELAFDKVAGFIVSRPKGFTAMFRRSASASGAAFEAGPRSAVEVRAVNTEVARLDSPTSFSSVDARSSGSSLSSTPEPRSLGSSARSVSASADASARFGKISSSDAIIVNSASSSPGKSTTPADSGSPLSDSATRQAADAVNDVDHASALITEAAARRRALAVLGWSPSGGQTDSASPSDAPSAGAASPSSVDEHRQQSHQRPRRATFVVRGAMPTSAESITAFAAEVMGIQYGAALKEGWLERSSQVGGIKPTGPATERLWFVLDDSSMRAYSSDTSDVSVLEIDLDGCLIEAVPPHSFRISRGTDTRLTLHAESESDCASWLAAMQDMRETYAPLVGTEGVVREESTQPFPALANRSQSSTGLKNADENFGADLERLVEDIATGKTTVPPSPQVSRVAAFESSTMTRFASIESVASVASVASHMTVGGLRRMILYPNRANKSQLGWSDLQEDEMHEFELVQEEADSKQATRARRARFLQDSDKIVYQVLTDGVADVFLITAATLDQLVARLADEELPDVKFIDLFLLGYRHITTAKDLMDRLLKRFNLIPPPDATPEEHDYFARWAGIIQLRTMGVVKRWVDQHFEDFARDADARAALDLFLDTVPLSNDALASLASRLRGIISEREAEYARWSMPSSVKPAWARPKSTVDFLHVEPREFAHQVALFDHQRFAAIHVSEFAIRIWQGNGPDTRHITEMIDYFNELSQLVASTICRQGYIKKRAVIIQKFIRVMQDLLTLNDYNGTMAILSGLSKSAVRRLKKTWELVPPKDVEAFEEIEVFMSADHNFRRYRDRLAKLERDGFPGPVVPFMAVFLRDLTFFQDGNPKMLRGDLVNFGKLRMICERILSVRLMQARKYEFQPTRSSAAVRSLLEYPNVIVDENMLYKCSCYCEPREEGPRSLPRASAKS